MSKSISPPRRDPPSRKVKSGGSDTLCGAELLIDDSVEVLFEKLNSRRDGGNGNSNPSSTCQKRRRELNTSNNVEPHIL